MKASDAIGCKTAQDQRHDIACNGSGIARPTSLRPASFGGIAVLLFLVGSISACSRGFGTEADSVQTTLGGAGSSTSAKTAPREKILLEGVRFQPDGSGLWPNSQPILDSAVETPKESPRYEGLCGDVLRPHRREAIEPSSVATARCDRVRLP